MCSWSQYSNPIVKEISSRLHEPQPGWIKTKDSKAMLQALAVHLVSITQRVSGKLEMS